MLTLHEVAGATKICDIVTGKRKTGEVRWLSVPQQEHQNTFHDLQELNTEPFRDHFEVSNEKATAILDAIQNGTTIEGRKFFQIKRNLKERLQIEVDLAGTSETLQLDFRPKKQFTPHFLVVGGTGSGKTHWVKDMILRNLKGPKANRRTFLVVSAQFESDNTLKELRQDKYNGHVIGFDAGEDGLSNSNFDNAEDYFDFIKMRIENTEPGTVVFLDDFKDTVFSEQLRRYVDRGLRVLRHKGVTLMMILHSLRAGVWSSQAHNSVGYMVVFPRSQKNKIVQFFNSELALPLKESRALVRRFALDSRVVILHKHTPECLIGTQLVRLL